MRILHFVGIGLLPSDPDAEAVGGTERVALELARVQAARGAEVCVAGPAEAPSQRQWRGVTVQRLAAAAGRLAPRKFANHLALAALTWTRRFDVVHLHEHPHARLVRARAVVVQAHNDIIGDPGTQEFDGAARRFWSGARRGHVQLGVSEYLAGRFVRALDSLGTSARAQANVGVCPNGVDLENFRAQTRAGDRDLWRRRWGFASDDVVFLFAGAIQEAKGVDHLAAAFTEVAAAQPQARLVIVGSHRLWIDADPEESEAFEERVLGALQPLIDEGRVVFLGPRSHQEMPSIMAAVDAVVLPSIIPEAFGLVVVEAFALGRPAVATRMGALCELVQDHKNGLLVDPYDRPGLAAAMGALVGDAGLRAQLSDEALRAAKNYSWEASVDRLERIYGCALAGAQLPGLFSADGMLDALGQGLDMGS
ncbi:glycosyltransferase family 4 protein [Caulobacter sp. 17J80-11]|uniref:glycosyltransferase family 4 protein n=1 Tax=Caulobacter sp. 17J80-11 TaxID=2763502 RepID=UPI001653A766|nr:glycosyltransferase family 4 protein [Caulobacter sp. 17J80-11]MBC6981488.1 glycosyltransferase family 4 protein [Caulobacter sp. 17J80-11]